MFFIISWCPLLYNSNKVGDDISKIIESTLLWYGIVLACLRTRWCLDVFFRWHRKNNNDNRMELMGLICYADGLTCGVTDRSMSAESGALTGDTIWSKHDDVVRWKHSPRYWPFVRVIHRWPHKGQWRKATSELSTILLPTKVRLILETWRYMCKMLFLKCSANHSTFWGTCSV